MKNMIKKILLSFDCGQQRNEVLSFFKKLMIFEENDMKDDTRRGVLF